MARLRTALGIALTAFGVMLAVIVAVAMITLPQARSAAAGKRAARDVVAYVPRATRLDAAEWAIVKNAARLRTMALARGRTAEYRSFAARLGLEELLTLPRVGRGRCAIAVSYLYDNLLDLHDAYPGEDWRPLRRLIRKQPPLSVCAPKRARRATYIG